MTDLASLAFQGPIATLTLQRPDARNALSIDLLRALHARADELASQTDAHVLLLTGAGPSFCAGMDLKAVLGDPVAPATLLNLLGDFTLKLRALPCVSLAVVQGAAIGGGCGLACVCDLAITHADAKVGYPEVDLGVCPAVVAPWLVRRVGAGPARRILLSGGLLTGRHAHQLGLFDHLVESPDELLPAAHAIAQRLAKGGPHALRATKALLNQIDGSSDPAWVRQGAELSARVVNHPDTQARLRKALK